MTKEELAQYADLVEEQKENEIRIEKLERDIDKLEDSIRKIVNEGTVIDKVSGGEGGRQSFRIEGFPVREYSEKMERLQRKRYELNARKARLQERQAVIEKITKQISEFMDSIDDSHVRRIVFKRYEEGMSWQQVAVSMGGGNTPDSARKSLERYLKDAD